MKQIAYLDDDDNKRNGFWLSLIFHIILIFLFLVPCFSYFNNRIPEEPQGFIVALGNPTEEEHTEAKKQEQAETKSAEVKNTVAKPVEKKSNPTEKSKAVTKQVISKTVEKESPIDASEKIEKEKANEMAELSRLKKEEEARRVEEEQKKAEAEAMAKAKAEAEAQKRAEEKTKAKSKFGSLFNAGDEDASESKGSDNGKPDSSVLEGMSSGSGKIGTGLGSRGVLFAPTIVDNTQKTGRVVVNICVNMQGQVVSSKFMQKGSTTTDAHLIGLAESSAKKYKFEKSTIEEQCGDIIIDFKLK